MRLDPVGRTMIGVILTSLPVCGAADVVDIANSVRRQGCGTPPAAIRPLEAHVKLDEAAQRVARGEKLETATSESGYRARESATIHVATAKGDDGIAQTLTQRFCDIVAAPGLHDIGVFQRGKDTWMVLARPLGLPGPADAQIRNGHVLELINEARSTARRCGRKKFSAAAPLKPVAALQQAALAHAQDMASRRYLGHKGSDQSMPADRATRAAYDWAAVAENVAAGQPTAGEVVGTWLASPGHCENLMSPRYSETGIAHAVNPDAERGIYWVQVFAAPE
jgi:uncharacterized protein YkwD